MCVEFRAPVACAFAAVPVDEKGHAFTRQQLRRRGDFEMQMRLASVSGSANARQNLPTPHGISCLHPQTSRLQMHVICKLAAAYVERDRITRHGFQRNWHCRVEGIAVSGDILG